MKRKERETLPEDRHEKEAASDSFRGGDALFGQESIRPSSYSCAHHGEILAQDVVWDRDDHPHCPQCNALLKPKVGA